MHSWTLLVRTPERKRARTMERSTCIDHAYSPFLCPRSSSLQAPRQPLRALTKTRSGYYRPSKGWHEHRRATTHHDIQALEIPPARPSTTRADTHTHRGQTILRHANTPPSPRQYNHGTKPQHRHTNLDSQDCDLKRSTRYYNTPARARIWSGDERATEGDPTWNLLSQTGAGVKTTELHARPPDPVRKTDRHAGTRT